MSEPIVCYIEGNIAFFADAPLDVVWGDDWNDAPYEHNAGRPYEWYYRDGDGENRERAPIAIHRVRFAGDYYPPCDCPTRHMSVEEINEGRFPWLRTKEEVGDKDCQRLYAGATIAEFTDWVERTGGISGPVARDGESK